ncbi:hypothetical protein AB0J83_23710 [Actinoplanes sp. NPDC049596]|uniref:hypothetical protein n=1 Tax=unclassified Actinoplanes TaxID=2626549 RepID=UPI003426B46E
MQWTPDATIKNALWIGGGQWAGKTTVAGILAERHGLVQYYYDFHAARGHDDRRVATAVRQGTPYQPPDWEKVWIGPTPAQMAADVLATFPQYFEWVLDDLRGIGTTHPVLAEGWGLRPELVAAVTDPARMVVMVPTDEWRRHQLTHLPRAGAVSHQVSDPALANRNRVARDRLIAADAVASARALGVRVIEVDGSRPATAIADEIADHFRL